MTNSIKGATAAIGPWDFALSLNRTADLDVIAGRKICLERVNLRLKFSHDGCGLRGTDDSSFHRDGRDSGATPDGRLLHFVAQVGNSRQRHGLAVRTVQRQILQCFDRSAFRIRRTADNADEVDVVAKLRCTDACHHAVQSSSDIFRRNAQLTRLVLQNIHLHDTRRFVPVENEI